MPLRYSCKTIFNMTSISQHGFRNFYVTAIEIKTRVRCIKLHWNRIIGGWDRRITFSKLLPSAILNFCEIAILVTSHVILISCSKFIFHGKYGDEICPKINLKMKGGANFPKICNHRPTVNSYVPVPHVSTNSTALRNSYFGNGLSCNGSYHKRPSEPQNCV